MPRTTNNPVDDPRITLRLKCGIHTIFLFVMLDWTFAKVSEELLMILHDRYPNGLTFSVDAEPVPLPEGDVKIVYGIPRHPNGDLSHGWKKLKVEDEDTVESSKLADVSAVAFALVDPESYGNVTFDVTVPRLDDYDEEY
ncbi:hypothetical protein GE21DRAFT_2359 [Neurospora crassa]|uniref:Uncharacterized protein n=1 Tax=Neurospora crassa (strain ATCC 24698 / 74-OR23-1A / CBS 708.71 / DSM 1257 / FGSC 987) TaxID=367110 RepID=Q7SHG6_NEUCR|nr:hypothetical protein NCU02938 [Neurospora crassa OR74A]EAA36384.1 hypothetical protein NCU02938 [Neurospora crassa OR74A]KAK3495736.1 hypothetical protein B0T13DRAFT_304328 [Neurospora crassa]KHE89287.1 hypothetical protein GE21DRAFT_2359 [Neurospora crassa]|eukprot:XP_965620.1 hypothetical protein NCU02938 [Neurospora crassa OR74A]